MKAVKLKIANLPVDGVQHPKGTIVMVPDVRAAELIRLGHAEAATDQVEVANPKHNPLADVIDPEPPGGLVFNPINALAPNVLDNPGLKKAAEITGAKSKSAKVQPGEVTEGDPKIKAEENVAPSSTANEIKTPGK